MSKKFSFHVLILGLAVLLTTSSCSFFEDIFGLNQGGGGGGGGSSVPSTETTVAWEYDGNNPFYSVPLGDAATVNVEISGSFAGEDIILIKANKGVTSVSADYTGTAAISESARSTSPSDGAEEPLTLSAGSAAGTDYRRESPPEAFLLPPPGVEPGTASSADSPFAPQRFSAPAESTGYGDNTAEAYSVGDSINFWQATEISHPDYNWREVSATLRGRGYYTYIWVDDERFDSGGTGGTDDNTVTQDQVNSLLEAFDGTDNATSNDGIYEWVSTLYGYEKGGGSGGDGGIDGDQRVHIFITDLEDDYSSGQSGGVFGYFWPKDEYTNDSLPDSWHSNTKEMFYIDAHFTEAYLKDMKSTLAHEYQHMIHYNQKYLEQGVSSSTWYNEMLSMLAEDFLQDKIGLTDGESPKSRTSTFVTAYPYAGITQWDGGYSYAMDYVFGAFLVRNFGGAPLVASMIGDDKSGRASITAALSSCGYSKDFDAVFQDFVCSNLFETAAGDFLAMDIGSRTETVNSQDYTLTGYNLFDYHNGSYPGPGIFGLTDQASLLPYGFTYHWDSDTQNLSGEESLTLTLTSPLYNTVEYYLVVRP